MFTHTPSYSLQPAGGRTRILVTTVGDGGEPVSAALVTVGDDHARALVGAFNRVLATRASAVLDAARQQVGNVCKIRRVAVAAFDGTRVDDRIGALRHAAEGLSTAERRAVRDELGRLFDGTEVVIVPVALCDEFGGVRFTCFANDALEACDDDEVLDVVEKGYALYESLLAALRAADGDVDEACDSEWIDVRVDDRALAGWVRHRRPHLAAALVGD